MFRLRVNKPGIERLRTIIGALPLTDADKAGPVLTPLNRVHVAQVKRAFSSRGATVASGPWPPWSPRYAAWRRKHPRTGNRMMRLTDSLFEKSTSTTHGGYIGRWVGGVRYIFGFQDDVGALHQNGPPKRSILDKTAADVREFAVAFVRFYRARIRQVARGAGRLR